MGGAVESVWNKLSEPRRWRAKCPTAAPEQKTQQEKEWTDWRDKYSSILAPRQDRIRKMPLDVLQLCGQLQVVGERGEPLAAAVHSGRLCCQARGGDVHSGQMRLVGLWRHGHGVIWGHGEMDPAGEGVFGFVLEVRVWTLAKRQPFKSCFKKKKRIHFSRPIKQKREELRTFWTPVGVSRYCPCVRPGLEEPRGSRVLLCWRGWWGAVGEGRGTQRCRLEAPGPSASVRAAGSRWCLRSSVSPAYMEGKRECLRSTPLRTRQHQQVTEAQLLLTHTELTILSPSTPPYLCLSFLISFQSHGTL